MTVVMAAPVVPAWMWAVLVLASAIGLLLVVSTPAQRRGLTVGMSLALVLAGLWRTVLSAQYDVYMAYECWWLAWFCWW